MKRIGLLVLLIVAFAAPAFAVGEVGDISAYADDQGAVCNLTSPGGNAIEFIYIVQKFSDGGSATGCRFKVTVPTGLTILSFTTSFVPIGDIKNDLSLAYGFCITQTTSLGYILAQSTSASPTCSYVSVVAADNFANAIATDCSFGEYTVGTGQGIVNPDGTCQCNIAVQPSTWGKVKALYR
ncbi:MAG TPA: hypothetical protein VFH88_03205 [Candidatus Krumholzibacteria bacterium]|nr:hypothetical protein [Candidatus Krumholzibacteria bacterium]